MTRQTIEQARAALDDAQAALDAALSAQTRAATRAAEARQAFYRARREVEAARVRDEKNAIARDRSKAKKLAHAYAITITRENFQDGPIYWVLGPEGIYGGGDGVPRDDGTPVRADPCEGDHSCTDWSGVLHNVKLYVTDIEALGAELAAQLRAEA